MAENDERRTRRSSNEAIDGNGHGGHTPHESRSPYRGCLGQGGWRWLQRQPWLSQLLGPRAPVVTLAHVAGLRGVAQPALPATTAIGLDERNDGWHRRSCSRRAHRQHVVRRAGRAGQRARRAGRRARHARDPAHGRARVLCVLVVPEAPGARARVPGWRRADPPATLRPPRRSSGGPSPWRGPPPSRRRPGPHRISTRASRTSGRWTPASTRALQRDGDRRLLQGAGGVDGPRHGLGPRGAHRRDARDHAARLRPAAGRAPHQPAREHRGALGRCDRGLAGARPGFRDRGLRGQPARLHDGRERSPGDRGQPHRAREVRGVLDLHRPVGPNAWKLSAIQQPA